MCNEAQKRHAHCKVKSSCSEQMQCLLNIMHCIHNRVMITGTVKKPGGAIIILSVTTGSLNSTVLRIVRSKEIDFLNVPVELRFCKLLVSECTRLVQGNNHVNNPSETACLTFYVHEFNNLRPVSGEEIIS